MNILKDEGGQLVPTERIELALIGSVVFIVALAMILKIDVGNLLTIIVSGFIGIITGAKLNSLTTDTTSCDTTEEDSP